MSLKMENHHQYELNVGISDGRFTEISSDALKANDKVIIGENQANGEATPSPTNTMRFRMF